MPIRRDSAVCGATIFQASVRRIDIDVVNAGKPNHGNGRRDLLDRRATMSDPLRQLSDEGVSIWLDDMSRQRLVSGNLKALVRDKQVVGVTTNPTIFQKAITT